MITLIIILKISHMILQIFINILQPFQFKNKKWKNETKKSNFKISSNIQKHKYKI